MMDDFCCLPGCYEHRASYMAGFAPLCLHHMNGVPVELVDRWMEQRERLSCLERLLTAASAAAVVQGGVL